MLSLDGWAAGSPELSDACFEEFLKQSGNPGCSISVRHGLLSEPLAQHSIEESGVAASSFSKAEFWRPLPYGHLATFDVPADECRLLDIQREDFGRFARSINYR